MNESTKNLLISLLVMLAFIGIYLYHNQSNDSTYNGFIDEPTIYDRSYLENNNIKIDFENSSEGVFQFYYFGKNNISMNNIKSQKDDNGFQYYYSVDVKAKGWHNIQTDIYNDIYIDGMPFVNKTNKTYPNYQSDFYNVSDDEEYRIIDNKTFLVGKWINFDGNWTTIQFYIGDLNNLVHDRVLKDFEIEYIKNNTYD